VGLAGLDSEQYRTALAVLRTSERDRERVPQDALLSNIVIRGQHDDACIGIAREDMEHRVEDAYPRAAISRLHEQVSGREPRQLGALRQPRALRLGEDVADSLTRCELGGK